MTQKYRDSSLNREESKAIFSLLPRWALWLYLVMPRDLLHCLFEVRPQNFLEAVGTAVQGGFFKRAIGVRVFPEGGAGLRHDGKTQRVDRESGSERLRMNPLGLCLVTGSSP